MLLPAVARNVAAALTDDEGELGFIIRFGRELRQHDIFTGADDGGRVLREDGRDFGNLHLGFDGMVAIVEAHADDFRRPGQWSQQPRLGQRDHVAGGLLAIQPRLDTLARFEASFDYGEQRRKARAFQADDVVA